MAGTKELIDRLRRNFRSELETVYDEEEMRPITDVFSRAAIETLAEILDGGETSTSTPPRKNKGGRKKGSKNKTGNSGGEGNPPETGE